jgi:hypothetical protein
MSFSHVDIGPVGKKIEGFDSAARAIITLVTSVLSRIICQLDHPSPSPLHVTLMLLCFPSRTMSPRRSQIAADEERMSRVRQCTVRLRIPVRRIRAARRRVEGWSGRRRILHETGRDVLVTRPRRISRRRSGVDSNAAPMPEWTLIGRKRINHRRNSVDWRRTWIRYSREWLGASAIKIARKTHIGDISYEKSQPHDVKHLQP